MRSLYISAIALVCLSCQAAPEAQQQPPSAAIDLDRFDVRTSEWVSLHFFAFHAARALSGEDYGFRTVPLFPEDAALLEDSAIAAAFEPVAEMYVPVLNQRLFRGPLFAVARQLGEGPQAMEDAEVRSTFEAFMPTYRQYFWPRHQEMAEAFAAEVRAGLEAHGPALLAATADELHSTWGDAHYPAYVSAYVNWAGAFSNDNVLFLGAADPDLAEHALEHDRFWHYLQFKATGEAARRVLGESYVPYARATGLASRSGNKIWYDALDAVWDEHDTLEERAMAAAAIVAAARN